MNFAGKCLAALCIFATGFSGCADNAAPAKSNARHSESSDKAESLKTKMTNRTSELSNRADPDFSSGYVMPRWNVSLAVDLGDLDGDGDLDGFAANFSEPNEVWLNNGRGEFNNSGQTLGSLRSHGLSLGDVDDDGDIDAFVANVVHCGDPPNKVWLNDGSAQFRDSGQDIGSGRSRGATLGDVNGDGALDVFTANDPCGAGGPNKVWINNGGGNFSNSGQLLGASQSWEIGLADLDGDTDLDAFVANEASQPNTVWRNNGDGAFNDTDQKLGAKRSRGLAIGDLDGDGDKDAFIANDGGPNNIWLNNGNAMFDSTSQTLGGGSSRSVALIDVDTDGDLDAFVANVHEPNRVWLNDGRANFTDSGQRLSTNSSRTVAFGDVDRDGTPDAFVANTNTVNKIWLNDGTGQFSNSNQSLATPNPEQVGLRDLDGDGKLDAFFAGNSGNSTVWTNDGDGGLTYAGESVGLEPSHGLALGDVDGNGSVDAFIANHGANHLWINDGNGGFNGGQSFPTLFSKDVALADIDSDGDLDAFVANRRVGDKVWINDGDGSFSDSGQSLGTGDSRSHGVVLQDFDGDFDPDAFVANASSNPNQVFENDGSGTFTGTGQDLGSQNSEALEAGDLDGDGDEDIFVANASADPNKVWLNDGNGNFSDSGQTLGSGNSHGLGLADIDKDGDLDAYVGNKSSEPNRVWLNDGSAVFSDSGLALGQMGAQDAAVGDLDGDGYPDAVAANRRTSVVWENSTNFPPSAEATVSRPVEVGKPVTLDGSGSSDPNDSYSALDFRWRLEASPPGFGGGIDRPGLGVTSFIPSKPGEYRVELSVTDPRGEGDVASATFVANGPPDARLTKSEYRVVLGQPIELDASASSDPEGEQLSYEWSISSPTGAGTESYSLSDTGSATPSATLTAGGTFEFEVVVEDSHGLTDRAEGTIEVNQPPEIDVQTSATLINLGDSLTVDLSGSSDPDGDSLSYNYKVVSQPAGSNLDVSSLDSSSIDIPPSVAGEYKLEAVVTDSDGAKTSETVKWTTNGPPQAAIDVSKPNPAIADKRVVETGNVAQFSAAGSRDDLSNQTLTYAWRLVAPSGSGASLQSPEGTYTSLRANTGGEYAVTLEVTDEHGLTGTTEAIVTYNSPPKAKIGQLQPVVRTGRGVALEGQNSSDAEDATGDLEYSWRLATSPGDSNAAIAAPGEKNTTVTPDTSGLYEIELAVTDTAGSTGTATGRFRANAPPKAAIERDTIEVNAGESFQVDASNSRDEETHQLNFDWSFTQTPDGVSGSELPAPTGRVPSLKLQQPGEYVLEVVVSDGEGASASAAVTVDVNGAPTFVEPTPTDSIQVVAGQKIAFEVAATDPDGDELDIGLVGTPEGAGEVMFEADKLEWDPTYDQLNEGELVFEFAATDGRATAERSIRVEVVSRGSFTSAEAEDPEQKPTCETIDCGEGETCHLGTCFEHCEGQKTCSGDKECLESGRCTSDPCGRIECEDGKRCYRGSCFSSCEQGCEADDKTCVDGRCTAKPCANVECPTGQTCYQGSCFEPCGDGDGCEDGQASCVSGRCTTDPCEGVQCPAGQKCYQGSCFGTCQSDGECEASQDSCIEGRCAASACESVQCPTGQSCHQGRCIEEDAPNPAADATATPDAKDTSGEESEAVRSRSGRGCGCRMTDRGIGPNHLPVELVCILMSLIGFRRMRTSSGGSDFAR